MRITVHGHQSPPTPCLCQRTRCALHTVVCSPARLFLILATYKTHHSSSIASSSSTHQQFFQCGRRPIHSPNIRCLKLISPLLPNSPLHVNTSVQKEQRRWGTIHWRTLSFEPPPRRRRVRLYPVACAWQTSDSCRAIQTPWRSGRAGRGR
jgi:hypothetical protein